MRPETDREKHFYRLGYQAGYQKGMVGKAARSEGDEYRRGFRDGVLTAKEVLLQAATIDDAPEPTPPEEPRQ